MNRKIMGDNIFVINRIKLLTDNFMKVHKRPKHLFSFHVEKCAFLIIDMQNFACGIEKNGQFPEIETFIDNINRLVKFSRDLGIPVIWVRHNFTVNSDENSDTDAGLYPVFHGGKLEPEICNLQTGTEICEKMDFDNSSDTVTTKNRYSAFIPGSSELPDLLKSLGRNQLIVAGVASNVCVESTIRDAMQFDYEVTLIEDATGTFDDIFKEMTLANIRLFFGDVKTTDEIIKDLTF